MPLIVAKSAPLPSDDAGDDSHARREVGVSLKLTEQARAMASVETVAIARRPLTHELRAVGKIQYNETALAVIVSRVDGYIERLYVDFTGVPVAKEDHLVDIYSPDLVVAQQELLVALSGPANNALIDLTKLKLRRWGLTKEQVDNLVENRQVSERVTLFSPIDGTVIERMAVNQAMVKAGEILYRIANLESVWVYLDIYESELSRVRQGQEVVLTAEAYPGQLFSGRIWFVNPMLDEASRSVKVIVNVANVEEKLKPGMFVSATMQLPILADGTAAPTGLEGQFTCPMHPQVIQSNEGKCPRCGMALKQIPGDRANVPEEERQVLAVPVSAVLDSGWRKLVFVEHDHGEFMPIEVTTGPRAGDYFPVIAGLEEGDKVAVRGSFLLDSQLQVSGLPSLLYPEGAARAAGHQHGDSSPPVEGLPAFEHDAHQRPADSFRGE